VTSQLRRRAGMGDLSPERMPKLAASRRFRVRKVVALFCVLRSMSAKNRRNSWWRWQSRHIDTTAPVFTSNPTNKVVVAP